MARDENRPLDTRSAAEAVAREMPDQLARLLGGRLYRLAGLLFLLAILFFFLEAIFRVLLIAFVGAILGVAFNNLVVRLPVGRKPATAIVAVGVLGAIAVSMWLLVTAVVDEIRSFVEDLPSIVGLFDQWEEWIQDVTGIEIEFMGDAGQQILETVLGGIGGGAVLAGAVGVVELVAMGILILMGAFFVVAEPNEKLLIPLLRTVPPERRDDWRRMFSLLGSRLSAWLLGTLVSVVVTGVLTVVIFLLLGAPYPILLGVLIGLFSIIPLIGPWIGGIVAVLATLFHDPALALWVALAVIGIQEVEGNLVRPMVMSGAANLHPFVTLLALLLFGSMFGILGAILSLPIVLAIGTAVEVLWVEVSLKAGDDEIAPIVDT